MATNRTRRRNFRSSTRPLRPLEWGGFSREVTIAAGTQDAAWVINPQDVAALHEPTLMRMLIQYAFSTGFAISNTADLGAAGIIRIMVDPDTTAVPAERPDPLQDPHADWAWHTFLPFAAGTNSVQVVLTPGVPAIDIVSMRKLSNGEGLLLVIDAPSSVSMVTSIGIRPLFKQ